jgi:hypothetical protein
MKLRQPAHTATFRPAILQLTIGGRGRIPVEANHLIADAKLSHAVILIAGGMVLANELTTKERFFTR